MVRNCRRNSEKYARPGSLPLISAYVLDVPNSELSAIGSNASTLYASHNATVHAFNFRTGVQSGAFFARRMMGINGAGVGVAVLDSGVAPNNETPVTYFQGFPGAGSRHAATDTHCYDALRSERPRHARRRDHRRQRHQFLR